MPRPKPIVVPEPTVPPAQGSLEECLYLGDKAAQTGTPAMRTRWFTDRRPELVMAIARRDADLRATRVEELENQNTDLQAKVTELTPKEDTDKDIDIDAFLRKWKGVKEYTQDEINAMTRAEVDKAVPVAVAAALAPVEKDNADLRKLNADLQDELKNVRKELEEANVYVRIVKATYELQSQTYGMELMDGFVKVQKALETENDRLKKELADLKPEGDQFIPSV